MTIKFKNNASTTTAALLSSSATSIEVDDGTVFPTLGSGEYFYATLQSTSDNKEIVKVTSISGDTLTVTRAQESTLAIPFASGSRIELRVTTGNIGDYLLL